MKTNQPKSETVHRLFFALWPTGTARKALKNLQKAMAFDGRPVPAENFHITLVFLGSVDAVQQGCIEKVAAGITAPAFDLCLDRIGSFPRARIIWSGISRTPPALLSLVEKLNRGFATCGFAPAAHPFTPHLTLVRKAGKPAGSSPHTPVQWPVEDFCLVESLTLPTGVRYRVLHCWPLEGV
ncbi:MAG: RNA 2',3'-cyclic phosphodiesterase [Gammaproteobacteria bacterium]|nr:RNA 2',3'-cyclic phosphodiesterase [Gammaproteobacteria bacterium]NNJ84761.1 RNA 2',3'-cyclic phosphodiesterase [Gammaproteobacteria bacterium]